MDRARRRDGACASEDVETATDPWSADSGAAPCCRGRLDDVHRPCGLRMPVPWPIARGRWPSSSIRRLPVMGWRAVSKRRQPFNWLFVLLDCTAGLCIAIVSVRELRPHAGFVRRNRALAAALFGYATFGLATAIDAVVPLRCGSRSAQACASQVWPLTPDDVLTGVAMVALCLAATTLAVYMTRRSPALQSAVPSAIAITLIGWSALGLAVIFGGASATATAACQYAFLTLTGVLAFVVPLGAHSSRRPSANVGLAPGCASEPPNRLAQEPGAIDVLSRGDGCANCRNGIDRQSVSASQHGLRRSLSPVPRTSRAVRDRLRGTGSSCGRLGRMSSSKLFEAVAVPDAVGER